MKKINWGIIGAGNIARALAQDVHAQPDAQLLAIGSRTVAKAQQFAVELNVPRAYGSYAELVADPDVDVIYVATPHVFHKEQSLLALENGKAVLIEKPFTMNAAEAQAVINAARGRNLFCMEAMWTRFIPAMRKAVALIEEGAIGDVQMITASLGFYNEFDPTSRLFDPNLGGGALLDLGVYPLAFCMQVLGRPSTLSSQAIIGSSNVDEYTAILLRFPGGPIAQISTSLRVRARNDAFVMGTRGALHIHAPLYRPTALTLARFTSPARELSRRNPLLARLKTNRMVRRAYQQWQHRFTRLLGGEQITVPCEGNGYGYEIAEAGRCLRAGLSESSIMPLNETLAIMETMDAIQAQWEASRS